MGCVIKAALCDCEVVQPWTVWLMDAGVVTECKCLGYPELPLKGNVDEGKFKLYYTDTGLLISTLDEEAQEDLRVNKNLGVYKGALYENYSDIKHGIRLGDFNIGYANNVYTFPYFCAFMVKEFVKSLDLKESIK